MITMVMANTECLLCVEHCFNCFAHINSFNPHTNPIGGRYNHHSQFSGGETESWKLGSLFKTTREIGKWQRQEEMVLGGVSKKTSGGAHSRAPSEAGVFAPFYRW